MDVGPVSPPMRISTGAAIGEADGSEVAEGVAVVCASAVPAGSGVASADAAGSEEVMAAAADCVATTSAVPAPQPDKVTDSSTRATRRKNTLRLPIRVPVHPEDPIAACEPDAPRRVCKKDFLLPVPVAILMLFPFSAWTPCWNHSGIPRIIQVFIIQVFIIRIFHHSDFASFRSCVILAFVVWRQWFLCPHP